MYLDGVLACCHRALAFSSNATGYVTVPSRTISSRAGSVAFHRYLFDKYFDHLH